MGVGGGVGEVGVDTPFLTNSAIGVLHDFPIFEDQKLYNVSLGFGLK